MGDVVSLSPIGPRATPHGGGMIPRFGEQYLHGIEPEAEQLPQEILCVLCLAQGVTDAPRQIVVSDGSSMCIPHHRGTMGA